MWYKLYLNVPLGRGASEKIECHKRNLRVFNGNANIHSMNTAKKKEQTGNGAVWCNAAIARENAVRALEDAEEFIENCALMCRILTHAIFNSKKGLHFLLFQKSKNLFGSGMKRQARHQ